MPLFRCRLSVLGSYGRSRLLYRIFEKKGQNTRQGFLFGSYISVRPTPKPDESISASVHPSETQKMLVYFVQTRQTTNFRPTRNLRPPIKPRPPKTARPPKIARQKGR